MFKKEEANSEEGIAMAEFYEKMPSLPENQKLMVFGKEHMK